MVAFIGHVPMKPRPLAWFDVAIMLGLLLSLIFTIGTFVTEVIL